MATVQSTTSRGLHLVIGAMGVALILVTAMWWMTTRQVALNTQQLNVERRLVHALQDQVRSCARHPHRCLPPLSSPPARTSPTSHRVQPTTRESTTLRVTRRDHHRDVDPSPASTRSPRPQPHPTPSSTPSGLCVLGICVTH